MYTLVIGGAGFIGSHLVSTLLANGRKVRVLDCSCQELSDKLVSKHNLEWITGDFSSEQVLEQALSNVTVVFHLVSTTQPQSSNDAPVFDVQSNLVATINLLEALRTRSPNIPIIFTSSGGTVYGKPKLIPILESHPTEPQCSYGIVKLGIEKYLAMYHFLYGMNYRVLRLANPYGPGKHTHRSQGLIPNLLSRVINDTHLEIWGDGSVVRDYLYIDDAISALLLAESYNGNERIFNIGSGKGYSVSEIIEVIETVTGKKADIRYTSKRLMDVAVNVLDIQRAKKELGWSPSTLLQNGIKKTFEKIDRIQGP